MTMLTRLSAALAGAVVLACMLACGVSGRVKEAAERAKTQNDLRQLAISYQNFIDTRKRGPANTQEWAAAVTDPMQRRGDVPRARRPVHAKQGQCRSRRDQAFEKGPSMHRVRPCGPRADQPGSRKIPTSATSGHARASWMVTRTRSVVVRGTATMRLWPTVEPAAIRVHCPSRSASI